MATSSLPLPDDFGKPRPVLIVQADLALADNTFTLLPITSDIARLGLARVPVEATAENGLMRASEVMIDLIFTSLVSRIRQRIGSLDSGTMQRVEDALMVHLGLV